MLPRLLLARPAARLASSSSSTDPGLLRTAGMSTSAAPSATAAGTDSTIASVQDYYGKVSVSSLETCAAR